jgi:hypothetical protein
MKYSATSWRHIPTNRVCQLVRRSAWGLTCTYQERDGRETWLVYPAEEWEEA